MVDTKPKPFVFVLMPFEASFDDVYKLGIRPAAEGAGAYCERVDEQIFVESILARLYNQIAKADLIVADMTGRNANVFYEVGYAHALGKTVILLTKNADDIPFDLKHYAHIVYQGSIAGLKETLQKRIAHHLANPSEKTGLEIALPEFTISGNTINADVCVEQSLARWNDGDYELVVSITNPHDTVFDWQELRAALVLPLHPKYDYRAVLLGDKRYLFDLGPIGRLLPGQWSTTTIEFYIESVHVQPGASPVEAELRIFTPNGPIPTHFYLRFKLK